MNILIATLFCIGSYYFVAKGKSELKKQKVRVKVDDK